MREDITRGSSPRVRGTLYQVVAALSDYRFIPASAGNAKTLRIKVKAESVHPRECGERLMVVQRMRVYAGSSPRVRGTLSDQPGITVGLRFIPASAGNAPPSVTLWRTTTVHPRECGERRHILPRLKLQTGSSPRVRGTPYHAVDYLRLDRFIPASAGNAWAIAAASSKPTVHPRECGERTAGGSVSDEPDGSSPRVRGTPRGSTRRSEPGRFIPASAGNASPITPRRTRSPVHPRECGERPIPTIPTATPFGSSPRVRGTRSLPGLTTAVFRFIPASAGNATIYQFVLLRRTVHPRECGERIGVG